MKLIKADGWSTSIAPVLVGGIPVAPLTTEQWCELMISDCHAARAGRQDATYHTAANGNVISMAATNPEMFHAVMRASTVAADGVPVLWGARLFAGSVIPDRAATTDLFHALARAAEQEGLSMYFLGATAQENAAAVSSVRKLYPNLKIVGSRNGYFNRAEEDEVVRDIVTRKPDVLWVALGMPREDLFVVRHLHEFEGIGWVKTCGGLFNFLSGLRRRAPNWMQRAGLEWAFRMALEPRRLFWRYFTTNVHALWLMASRSGANW